MVTGRDREGRVSDGELPSTRSNACSSCVLSFLSVETLLLRVSSTVLVTLNFEPDVLSDSLELLHGLPDPCTSGTVTIIVLLSINMGIF